MQKSRIKELMVFEGLGKKKVDAVPCGEICALIGIDGFEIGDTICDYENPEPLPPIAIDEPTMSMLFTIDVYKRQQLSPAGSYLNVKYQLPSASSTAVQTAV